MKEEEGGGVGGGGRGGEDKVSMLKNGKGSKHQFVLIVYHLAFGLSNLQAFNA